jgi:hypothetical protein
MLRSKRTADYSDDDVSRLVNGLVEPAEAPEPREEEQPMEDGRQIFVVGGDYFSSAQYKAVRHEDDGIFSGFATSDKEIEPEQMQESMDFCTETLAQIYAEQGYMEQAKQIYSTLSLRYPEKSIYFAALIEKLDKN